MGRPLDLNSDLRFDVAEGLQKTEDTFFFYSSGPRMEYPRSIGGVNNRRESGQLTRETCFQIGTNTMGWLYRLT